MFSCGRLQQWGYLSSIPLSGGMDSIALDSGNNLYFAREGTNVRTIASGGTEQPFISTPDIISRLQGIGQSLQ